jgi:hypothetical protein
MRFFVKVISFLGFKIKAKKDRICSPLKRWHQVPSFVSSFNQILSFSQVAPLMSQVAPLMSRVPSLMSQVAPLMSRVPPLMSRVAPLMSWVAPLFSWVAPLFYLKGLYTRGLYTKSLYTKSLYTKKSLHKCDAGVWGRSPQQVEVHAEGMVSELASDPCRRHVLQLV